MATAAARARYERWVSAGKPFTLVTPALALLRTLRMYGYVVYSIGNDDHLLAATAEDHTPYSQTGWPVAAKFGYGYALDVMPPPPGSGLPTLQQLGAQISRDRSANVPGISWLKYMNWEPDRDNGGRCWHDSWTPDFDRDDSSDRGHIHISARTGMETSTIGRDYDPVERIRNGGKDDQMTPEQLKQFEALKAQVKALQEYIVNGAALPGIALTREGGIDRYALGRRIQIVEQNAKKTADGLTDATQGLGAVNQTLSESIEQIRQRLTKVEQLPPGSVTVDQVLKAVGTRLIG